MPLAQDSIQALSRVKESVRRLPAQGSWSEPDSLVEDSPAPVFAAPERLK